jgi:hypothetical protein
MRTQGLAGLTRRKESCFESGVCQHGGEGDTTLFDVASCPLWDLFITYDILLPSLLQTAATIPAFPSETHDPFISARMRSKKFLFAINLSISTIFCLRALTYDGGVALLILDPIKLLRNGILAFDFPNPLNGTITSTKS